MTVNATPKARSYKPIVMNGVTEDKRTGSTYAMVIPAPNKLEDYLPTLDIVLRDYGSAVMEPIFWTNLTRLYSFNELKDWLVNLDLPAHKRKQAAVTVLGANLYFQNNSRFESGHADIVASLNSMFSTDSFSIDYVASVFQRKGIIAAKKALQKPKPPKPSAPTQLPMPLMEKITTRLATAGLDGPAILSCLQFARKELDCPREPLPEGLFDPVPDLRQSGNLLQNLRVAYRKGRGAYILARRS